ncbi:MAG: DNA glycosylase, partial [Micrococcales bacterium]
MVSMPEGDVVSRVATRLDQAMRGQQLTRCEFRVPRFATVDLTGSVVVSTVARGKHLLTRLDR